MHGHRRDSDAKSSLTFSVSDALKNSALLTELGHALDDATSGAKAMAAGFVRESLNYRLFDSDLTRMFLKTK